MKIETLKFPQVETLVKRGGYTSVEMRLYDSQAKNLGIKSYKTYGFSGKKRLVKVEKIHAQVLHLHIDFHNSEYEVVFETNADEKMGIPKLNIRAKGKGYRPRFSFDVSVTRCKD